MPPADFLWPLITSGHLPDPKREARYGASTARRRRAAAHAGRSGDGGRGGGSIPVPSALPPMTRWSMNSLKRGSHLATRERHWT